jgi:hypothetical protein
MAVINNYEMTRQIIFKEMEDCDRLVRIVMDRVTCAEDEVLFNAKGGLVKSSRSGLLAKKWTYFFTLLSSPQKTDAIGKSYPRTKVYIIQC